MSKVNKTVELEAVRFARRNGLILALGATCPLCAKDDPIIEFRHPTQKDLVLYGHMRGGPCVAQGIWRLLKLPELALEEIEDVLKEAESPIRKARYLQLPRRAINPPGRPTWDEIAGMLDRAKDDRSEKYTYAEGVTAALGWVIGEEAEPPL